MQLKTALLRLNKRRYIIVMEKDIKQKNKITKLLLHSKITQILRDIYTS